MSCCHKLVMVWWRDREQAVQRERRALVLLMDTYSLRRQVAILEKPCLPQVTSCSLIQNLGRKLLFVQPSLGNLEEASQSGSYCVGHGTIGQAVQGEN